MCCFRIGTLEVKKRLSSHAHKTGCRYLLMVLFKASDEQLHPFHMRWKIFSLVDKQITLLLKTLIEIKQTCI